MSQPYVDGITDTVSDGIASSLTAGQIAAGEGTLTVSVVCPDRWFLGDVAVVTSRDGHAFAGEVEGMDVCTGEITIRLPLRDFCGPGQRHGRSHTVPGDHRPPARLVVLGQVIQQLHQTIKGMTIVNVQILPTGTDRNYAAALDWVKQTAASGTLSPSEDEGLATEELVAALLPIITSEHATAIVAQQIRQTLSAPWTAPAEGAAPAGHGTLRNADPYSARCPDCGDPTGAAAEARKLLGSWAE